MKTGMLARRSPPRKQKPLPPSLHQAWKPWAMAFWTGRGEELRLQHREQTAAPLRPPLGLLPVAQTAPRPGGFGRLILRPSNSSFVHYPAWVWGKVIGGTLRIHCGFSCCVCLVSDRLVMHQKCPNSAFWNQHEVGQELMPEASCRLVN